MIRAVLLDLAGVVYQGDQPLPGAVQAIASLRNAGFRLRFLTNTTRMPRRALLSRLNSMGIAIADELFAPAQAACAWLAAKGLSAHLLIHPDLQEDFVFSQALGLGQGLTQVIQDFFTRAGVLAVHHPRLVPDLRWSLVAQPRFFESGTHFGGKDDG